MRILLTNDDGIHAEGLKSLEKIARALTDDVWIVAPEYEQSGASRALTLADPIRVRKEGDRKWAVAGTPTDCVMLGVRELVAGVAPDLVLSGVNRGQNIAEDVTLSGTVAGAIEGMALGIPSIALSQAMLAFHDEVIPFWETAEHFGPGIVRRLRGPGRPDHGSAAGGDRGLGHASGFPRHPHPDVRQAHRPARSRLLLDGLFGADVEAGGRNRPEGGL